MPDITMCSNCKCKLNKDCYRFKINPDKIYQSYALFKPTNDKCDYYIKIKEMKQ